MIIFASKLFIILYQVFEVVGLIPIITSAPVVTGSPQHIMNSENALPTGRI